MAAKRSVSKTKKSLSKKGAFSRPGYVAILCAGALGVFSLAFMLGLLPIAVRAAGFSYTISISNADFTGNTLTVTAPVDVVKYVGTETSQWVKVIWGDGNSDVLQAMAQTNFALSLDGKDFSIHNLVVSHAYLSDGAFTVTAKVYHGNESGNEGSASESNTVTFQTENTAVVCSDAIDNDHDGLIDLLDPDCAAFLNHAPVANDNTYSTNEDTQLSVAAPGVLGNDTDDDSNALTAVLVSSTSHGTLALNANGSFTYMPDANWSGTDTFTYKANDGALDSATNATVSIVVSNTNDAPVAANDAYPATEDTALVVVAANGVLGNDSDIDGNPITAILESDVNDGTLSLSADGSFTYMPDANWNGIDTFTYKASDGYFNSSTATVVITVAAVPDAPTASLLSITTNQNIAVSDNLLGGDVDGDTITFATTTNPAHGTLVAFNSATGAFTYTPDENYIGADGFSFTTTDTTSLTSTSAHISITVAPVTENTSFFCSDGIDNDGDTLIDLSDSDCAAFIPVVTPPGNGGGSGGGNGGGSSGGGSSGGGGGGGGVIGSGPFSIGFVNSNGGGLVLGTSTEALPNGCSALLNSYLRIGGKNDSSEVKKLQTFLNQTIGTTLPISGVFGPMTFAAVEQFQLQKWEKVLRPWVAFGLPTDHTTTGYVYKTTRHTINLLNCSTLNIPEPQLP